MSRRRVSVRELGPGDLQPGDLQGWLQRQAGARRFMGSNWRRNWFVLKNSSLYWYPSHMAEKAEGFLDLTDFTVQPIRINGKQHVIKVSQRGVATVVMAAESFAEMSLWLDKLSAALQKTRSRRRSSRECYSQISDPESEDSVFYSCPPYTELPTTDPGYGEFPPPCFTSSPFYNHVLTAHRSRRTTSTTSTRRTSSSSTTSTSRTSSSSTTSTSRTSSSESSEAGSFRRTGSWLDLPTPNTARSAADPPHFLLSVGADEGEEVVVGEGRPDGAVTSSSPIGRTKPSNQRGRRGLLSPFTSERRQENLQLVRILNPPPKMEEEADLLAMEAVLADPTRHAQRFWNWHHKFILLQEITYHKRPAGGARDARIPTTKERNVAETSV